MPLDTILCLDTSTSMAGAGIQQLKRAVNTFMDGVIETATQTGLKENVAIVEFGCNTRIVHNLSTDYGTMKRQVAGLRTGGSTPMFEGLMEAMKEIVNNGGVVALRGTNIKLTPRVILMTDGQPDNKEKVLATAIAFSDKGYSEVGLPHPIPIACIGLGSNVDKELLAVIAAITSGMFSVGDATEMSTFFRRQVLLIRFLIQFQSDMSALRNMLVLRAFLEQLGERVDDEEAEALMKLLIAMLILGAAEEEAASGSRAVGSAPGRLALPAPTGVTSVDGVEVITVNSGDGGGTTSSGCCCTIL